MKKIFILMAVFMFSGCATLQENYNMTNCKFALLAVEPTEFSFSNISFDVVLAVTNPARTAASVKRFDGDLFINDINITKLVFKDVVVEPGTTKTLKSSLEIPVTSLGKFAGLVTARSSEIIYEVKGTMYFATPLGDIGVPVTVFKDNIYR